MKRITDVHRIVFCVFEDGKFYIAARVPKVRIEPVDRAGESLCYAFVFSSSYEATPLTPDERQRLERVRNNRFFTETLQKPDSVVEIEIDAKQVTRKTLDSYTVEELLAHLRQRLNAKITVEI